METNRAPPRQGVTFFPKTPVLTTSGRYFVTVKGCPSKCTLFGIFGVELVVSNHTAVILQQPYGIGIDLAPIRHNFARQQLRTNDYKVDGSHVASTICVYYADFAQK